MESLLSTARLGPLIKQQRAALAEVPRTLSRLLSVPSVLRAAREAEVGTTPHDVVLTRGHFKLLRYRREEPSIFAEPVLFCYALVNRPYILDLQPDKSVVQRYLQRGLDVYMIDWGVPTDADQHLTLDDYVCGFLTEAVDYVLAKHRTKRLNMLGYCMGGTLASLYTSLHPERVQTLTLLATPIDFSGKESLLSVWSDPRYFDVDAFIDANGNCPARFLQNTFLYIKPVQNLIEKRLGLYEQLDDPAFVKNYFALERWVNDNIPVAGETFREFVKKLYQRNELIRGTFHLGNKPIDLGRIRCPLLLLTAKNDHLVAPPSTEGIRALVRSLDVKLMTIDSGHVGLVVGGKAQKKLWPEATRWLASRSTTQASEAAIECAE